MTERADTLGFHLDKKAAMQAEYRAGLQESGSFLPADQAKISHAAFSDLAGSQFKADALRQSAAKNLGNELRHNFAGLIANIQIADIRSGDSTPAPSTPNNTPRGPGKPSGKGGSAIG